MIVIRSIIFFSLIFSLWKVEINSDFPEVPKSLKGTNWYSQFYHYHNNYYFKTDSTGSSEDGQVALSCPIDTTALGISGDTIIYSNPEKFKYKITDTILRIEYLDWRPNDTIYSRVFYFRRKHGDWISEYEYAYGNEYLKIGKRTEIFKR